MPAPDAPGEPTRRRLLAGGGCLGLAGLAAATAPRPAVPTASRAVLDALAPSRIASWDRAIAQDAVPANVGPAGADANWTTAYTYSTADAPAVTVVFAYHPALGRDVAVHRPEICYQVSGLRLDHRRVVRLAIAPFASPAGVTFHAVDLNRAEDVLYWSRVGNVFPTTLSEQRQALFGAALRGVSPDAFLLRLSAPALHPGDRLDTLQLFAGAWASQASTAARRLALGI